MRQTQDGQVAMGRVQFALAAQSAEPPTPQAESWLVVFDEAPAGFCTTTPRERRILFVTEQPEIKKYPRSYLGQFGTVVSPYDFRSAERRSMVMGNPCHNWYLGASQTTGKYVSTFARLDEFRPMPHKTGLISVVCSHKTAIEAQRASLKLVRLLKEQLGDVPTWMVDTTNVFAPAVRMLAAAPEYCRKQPALARPEPIWGVGRADVAAIYKRPAIKMPEQKTMSAAKP